MAEFPKNFPCIGKRNMECEKLTFFFANSLKKMPNLEDALADIGDPGLEAELDHRVAGLQLQL